MADYRFYFLSPDNKIVGVHETAECADDAQAAAIANKLLAEQAKYPCIEIWEASRKVAKHCR